MRRALLGFALALPVGVLWATGCGDDEIFGDDVDGGPVDPGTADAAPATDGGDAGVDGGPSCGEPSTAPPRLLISMNNATTSELVAVNLATKTVDGRLTYDGFIGTTDARGADAYLMQQATDLVARLDRDEPWKVASSWNVRGDDRADGGLTFADPAAVVAPVCQKAYVLRYNRNKIAVVDSTAQDDGGAPQKFIDLASLVQAEDTDGRVDMTSAVYVASKKRLYVLLGNNDLKKVTPFGVALCASTSPTVIAIDTETDQLVSLGGSGPGGGITLGGYSPSFGVPMLYDVPRDRLVVLSAGCNVDVGDGGAGPVARRRVEAVDLVTGQVSELLSLNDKAYPSAMALSDGTHAAIGFFGQAFFWDPSTAALGGEVPGGFDFFAGDGKGALVGARKVYFGDGGTQIEVARVPYDDAGAPEILAVDPFTDNSGFMSGAEVWPPPKP